MAQPKYKISSFLRSSPGGDYYKGRDITEGRPCIIKYSTDHLKLNREHEILQEFESEHLLKSLAIGDCIGEAGESDVVRGLILEDILHVTLADIIKEGELSIEDSLIYVRAVAQALAVIHAKGYALTNLNPNSIWVEVKTKKVLICDLDSTLQMQSGEVRYAHRDVQAPFIAYSAPEQTGGLNRTVDTRCDIYSLGVIMYELLSGSLPYSAEDELGSVHAHLVKTPLPLQIRGGTSYSVLSSIVEKMLRKEPESRYQTISTVIRDISFCLDNVRNLSGVTFKAGEGDVSPIFRPPQVVVGRSLELDILKESFLEVVQGGRSFVSIYGPSGSGKSSLVRELYPVFMKEDSIFIETKFELQKRDIPLLALSDALQSIVTQLAGGRKGRLSRIEQRLALLNPAEVSRIIKLVPGISKLARFSGNHAAEIPSNFDDFVIAISRFLMMIAGEGTPLVIFLDDVQWSDTFSLQVIKKLLMSESSRYCIIIGAYRSDDEAEGEVHSAGYFELTNLVKCTDIKLSPLNSNDVHNILVVTFGNTATNLDALTRFVFTRTEGNPLFVVELLKSLVSQGIVAFDFKEGRWQWDESSVTYFKASDTLIDFMCTKIRGLSHPAQVLLRQAACIGNTFEIKLLLEISDSRLEWVISVLHDAERLGLISKLSVDNGADAEVYEFYHDKVVEALYKLNSNYEVALTHLLIAKALRRDLEKSNELVLEVAAHYNRAFPVVQTSVDKQDLARLNLKAAQQAISSGSFNTAVIFCDFGLKFLVEEQGEDVEILQRNLQVERVSGLISQSRYEEAIQGLSGLDMNVLPADLRAHVFGLYSTIFALQGESRRGIEAGVKALKILGVNIPDKIGILSLSWARFRLWINIKLHGIESLKSKEPITRPQVLLILNLVARLNAMYLIRGEFKKFGYGSILRLLVHFRYGYDSKLPRALVGYANFLATFAGKYHESKKIATFANQLAEHEGDISQMAAAAGSYAVSSQGWHEHWDRIADGALVGVRSGSMGGDPITVSVAAAFGLRWTPFRGGDDARTTMELFCQTAEMTKSIGVMAVTKMMRRYQSMLSNETPSDYRNNFFESLELEISNLESANWDFYAITLRVMRMEANFHFGEIKNVLKDYEFLRQKKDFVPVNMDYVLWGVYGLLAMFYLDYSAKGQARTQFKASYRWFHKEVLRWSQYNPVNFMHIQYLLEAIHHAFEGRNDLATASFLASAESARENHYGFYRGLALEVYSNLLRRLGKSELEAVNLEEARNAYVGVGAHGKSAMLKAVSPATEGGKANPLNIEDEQPVVASMTDAESIGSFEIESLLEAVTAISSEWNAEGVKEKMLRFILSGSGASRGIFVRTDGQGKLYMDVGIELGRRIPAIEGDSQEYFSSSIVRYVVATGEVVILNNLIGNIGFSDSYLTTCPAKSVLCLPVLARGRSFGAFYLENLIENTYFSSERVTLCRYLASMAATAMDNAALYAELDRKIYNRTQEIRSILENINQGILTVLPELKIAPDYSKAVGTILNSDEIGELDAWNLLFSNTLLSQEQKALLRGVLDFEQDCPASHIEVLAEKLPDELLVEAKDGTVCFVEVSWIPRVEGGKLVAILVTLKDVTKQKKLLRDESVSQLVSGIAHEFNNPLSIVQGSIDSMGRRLPELEDSPVFVRIRGQMIRAIDRVVVINKTLLDLSRAPEEYRQPSQNNLSSLVLQSIGLGQKGLSGTWVVDIAPEVESLFVQCSDAVFVNILGIVIRNAMEASGHADASTSVLKLSASKQRGYVSIEVEDHGVGVPIGIEKRIFFPFYTSKQIGSGLGLNLYLAATYAQNVGGALSLRSARNPTIFSLVIPLATSRSVINTNASLIG